MSQNKVFTEFLCSHFKNTLFSVARKTAKCTIQKSLLGIQEITFKKCYGYLFENRIKCFTKLPVTSNKAV